MPELPTTSKGAATSRRILDAAAKEVSAYGIAGARVDRIIAAARTNKAQLYAYFGSKEGLFDAVVADLLGSAEGDRFDVGGMADWAVALYNKNLRRPARCASAIAASFGSRPRLSRISPAGRCSRRIQPNSRHTAG